ncbi:MAG: hypothetical protein QOI70_1128 [Microbacteriaceae bacterium]|nr:hypothetical protein [Microbacteriaceae bacterium]
MKLNTNTISAKYTFSALAGLSLLGAVAGCTSTAQTSASNNSSSAPVVSEAPSTAAGSGSGGSTYKDGTYTEDGTYESPAGLARITVKVTLAKDIVTAINVNGHATDATAKSYQGAFDSGIAGKVVGKKIDSLNVTVVSGSSLTSGGFDEAIKKIEASARA